MVTLKARSGRFFNGMGFFLYFLPSGGFYLYPSHRLDSFMKIRIIFPRYGTARRVRFLLPEIKLEIMAWEEGGKPRKVIQLGIKGSSKER